MHIEPEGESGMSLDEIGPTPRERRCQAITTEIAAKYGIKVENYIRSGFLRQPMRSARIEFCYRMSTEMKFSTTAIAKMARLADHTTVYYCIKRFAALQGDPKALKWWKRKNAQSRKSCVKQRGENRAVNPYAQRHHRSDLIGYMKDEFFKGGDNLVKAINFFFRYDRTEDAYEDIKAALLASFDRGHEQCTREVADAMRRSNRVKRG